MFWVSPEFDAALQQKTTFLAYGLRLTRRDGVVAAWTNLRRTTTLAQLTIPLRPGRSVIVPGATYDSRAALRVSNLQMSDMPSQVDNMEATLNLGAALDESQVRRGLFEGARFGLLIYDWRTPTGTDGVPRALLRLTGDLGERAIKGDEVTWKLRSLAQKLKGDVLEVTSRDSRARWGDPELADFNLDGNTADGHAARVTGAVAEVDPLWPRRRFRLAGAAGYPDARFEDGTLVWLGAALDGFECGVLQHDPTTGWLTLARETPSAITNGALVRAQIRAPRTLDEWKRFLGDARKFAGEPNIPSGESVNRITG